MFDPRANNKYLSGLCRRVATELASGIDVRRTWAREVDRAPLLGKSTVEQIRVGIAQGDPLADAVEGSGQFFPVLFRRLVRVGEETGHLSEVFAQLADHYEYQVTLRRQFVAGIAWPLFQLALALGVVGFLIWIMGIIQSTTNSKVDLLGFGLVGEAGLFVYLLFLATVGVMLFIAFQAARRGMFWIAPVQLLVMKLPGLGKSLRTLALARMTWTMHMTMSAGMEVRRALALALESTHNTYYMSRSATIVAAISAGREINEGMIESGGFPPDFVDAVEVGERSGRLVESMGILSRQYQEQARMALAMLTKIAGFVVWLMVAILIIMLIFRLFSFYVGQINEAIKM